MSSDKYKSGTCVICTNYFNLLHWHHTIPQALGGKDSLQIPLCSDCHNVLHAHAEGIVANIRSSRKISRVYWNNSIKENNARPYLEILVKAILDPPLSPEDKETKISIPVPYDVHRGLHLLKMDKNLGSLVNTVLYCIVFTLKSKGILSGNDKHKEEKQKTIKKSKTSLW